MSLDATCWAMGLRGIQPAHKLALVIISDSAGCGDRPAEIELTDRRVTYWANLFGCAEDDFRLRLSEMVQRDILREGDVEGRDGGQVRGLILNFGWWP